MLETLKEHGIILKKIEAEKFSNLSLIVKSKSHFVISMRVPFLHNYLLW